jgi:predicted RNase H-like HicB family nuclease
MWASAPARNKGFNPLGSLERARRSFRPGSDRRLLMLLTAVLIPDPDGGFTALNPETGTTSQGESVEEAVANLREATELYLEEFPLRT